MKTRKTRIDQRNAYVYTFADGTTTVLQPGIDGVTEADIAMLHRMDDREVENDNGEWKPPLQPWQKKSIEDWVSRHPDKEVPNMTRLSLDVLFDAKSQHNATDKSTISYLISDTTGGEISEETQMVRDFMDMELTDLQRVVCQRVLIEGARVEDVAESLQISHQAVSAITARVVKMIRGKFNKKFTN